MTPANAIVKIFSLNASLQQLFPGGMFRGSGTPRNGAMPYISFSLTKTPIRFGDSRRETNVLQYRFSLVGDDVSDLEVAYEKFINTYDRAELELDSDKPLMTMKRVNSFWTEQEPNIFVWMVTYDVYQDRLMKTS